MRTGIPPALRKLLEDPVSHLVLHNASMADYRFNALRNSPSALAPASLPVTGLAASQIGLLQVLIGVLAGSRSS